MIREHAIDPHNSVIRIEVLSNLSLSLDRLAGFFLVLSTVTLLVALWPTLMGYWPIMVIAIIHLGIVGWCFRLAWRGNWARQDITIDRDRFRIESRTVRGEEVHEGPTGWARVVRDARGGEPSVSVVLRGRPIEVGRFVPADERMDAADRIDRAIRPWTAWSAHGHKESASSE